MLLRGCLAGSRPQPAAPLPPGSPLIGRPDTADAKKLAPVPAPPLAAAADKLPVDKLKAAEGIQGRGLCQRHAQCPLARARRQGHRVRRLAAARTRSMPSSTRAASARSRSSPRASIGRTASPSRTARSTSSSCRRLSKIDNIEDKLDNPPKPTVILRRSAEGRGARLEVSRHRARQQALLRDRPALQQLHAARRPRPASAASISTAAAWRSIAQGIRNTVGFDWHPVSKELYFTDNSRDWMSEDLPNDELNRMHQGRPALRLAVLLPGQPARSGIRLGPLVQRVHAAGRADGTALGARSACASTPATCSRRSTSNQIFIARHGSWNRTNKFGGDVVLVNAQQGRQREVRSSRSSPASSRTTTMSAGRSTCWS